MDRGDMQIGSLTALLTYLVQILMSVMMATFTLIMVPRATVSADRIGAVLDTESSVMPPRDGIKQKAQRGQLRFSSVTYQYPGAHAPVLRDITFEGHPGETTAIIGSTGADNWGLFQASYCAQFLSGLIMPIMMFVGNLNYVVIAVLGALRVTSGTMSLGEVQAFIQYSRQFTQPITQAASMINLLQSGVSSAERVFELLDADEERSDEHHPSLVAEPHGRVTFEHVSFRYEQERPLIEDLSMTVELGQTVAIVGPTGAGKTTLVNLIMRFYELDSGRITLDGVDTSAMSRADLRSRVGMVLQDTWRFKGTIRENIAYGHPEASEAEILAAARATFVERFVHSLPDGYDTVIDEDGTNISAGEKQLITIARAFVAQPALLILDEATSSVDTRTQLLLQHAMSALRSDRTSFVIAHRLSTIRDADLILVMEDGRIVESGTHEELLSRAGAYAQLYDSQFLGSQTVAA